MMLAGETAVLAIALIVVVGLATIGYAIATVYLLGRLQSHHQHVYKSLGKPGVYAGNWYDWIKVTPFILGRDYLAISDLVVTRSGMWARTTLMVWTAGVVALFVLFAAFGG